MSYIMSLAKIVDGVIGVAGGVAGGNSDNLLWGNRVLRYGGEIVSVYIDLRWRESSIAGENRVYWVWYDDYIGPI
jgi:hypothetical protein